uniref:Odorant receptor n=1 Tax=Protaetia brevitarsis TaxID=348688 RepID=A0A411HQZ7_PROBE|nr:odorant receptor [Protaetia brevitarsis]
MEMGFFDLNVKILKLSGLWVPDKEDSNYMILVIYNSICVCYSMIYFTIAELVALKESASDLNDLIANLNMTMSFILTLAKVFGWFYYRKNIVRIIKLLEAKENTFSENNVDNENIISEKKRFKNIWTKSFFIVASLVPISAGILSLTDTVISGNKYINYQNDSTTIYLQKLPYHSWIPFNYASSKYSFSFAVITQCLALLNCGYITVGLDMMFVALVSLVTAHFTVCSMAFEKSTNVRREISKQLKDSFVYQKVLMRECDKRIKKCVKHLQVLIGVCQELETIYSPLVLLQVLISLVVLCTCLYLVSSLPIGMRLLGNELAYLLAIEIQVATYSYVGNELTYSALEIPTAIYQSKWSSTSLDFKKIMLITMMRMQKPVHISVGKFSALTLNTFVMIAKTSYSIFAVLKGN